LEHKPEKEIIKLPTADLLSAKNRLLLLIVQLSKKKSYMDVDDILDEALEILSEDYKDEKVARIRIKQMIEELNEEHKISISYYKSRQLITPHVVLSDGAISIQKVYFKTTMILAIIVSWLLWTISWIPPITPWMLFVTFANALLVTISYFNYQKRFVIDIQQKQKE